MKSHCREQLLANKMIYLQRIEAVWSMKIKRRKNKSFAAPSAPRPGGGRQLGQRRRRRWRKTPCNPVSVWKFSKRAGFGAMDEFYFSAGKTLLINLGQFVVDELLNGI